MYYSMDPSWNHFSTSYTSLFIFCILIPVINLKDLKIFMRFGSFGVVFVIFLLVFIMAIGIIGLTNTKFEIGNADDNANTVWTSDERYIILWNTQFGSLAGILCTGYFLHTCSMPILRSSKNPEKTNRDLFWGYFLVMISYIASGSLGYIGFIGSNFSHYFE